MEIAGQFYVGCLISSEKVMGMVSLKMTSSSAERSRWEKKQVNERKLPDSRGGCGVEFEER